MNYINNGSIITIIRLIRLSHRSRKDVFYGKKSKQYILIKINASRNVTLNANIIYHISIYLISCILLLEFWSIYI